MGGNGVVNQLFVGSDPLRPDTGGDDGVVIGDLGVVDDPLGKRQLRKVEGFDIVRPDGLELVEDLGDARLHILTEIA